jgi:SAM-dependent methyltransferase
MTVLQWNPAMVSNAPSLEAAAIRNYWEQRLIREAVGVAAERTSVRLAYDVGAGYGRLACVLTEFAKRVVAFERNAGLLGRGRSLNPDVHFIPVETLAQLPADDASGEFAMTFTVLQHLTDRTCEAVMGELKRIVRHGHVLLVEDTDDTQPDRDLPHDETGYCRHRAVSRYAEGMAPWQLVQTWPRLIEPTHQPRKVGTAMLFACKP